MSVFSGLVQRYMGASRRTLRTGGKERRRARNPYYQYRRGKGDRDQPRQRLYRLSDRRKAPYDQKASQRQELQAKAVRYPLYRKDFVNSEKKTVHYARSFLSVWNFIVDIKALL